MDEILSRVHAAASLSDIRSLHGDLSGDSGRSLLREHFMNCIAAVSGGGLDPTSHTVGMLHLLDAIASRRTQYVCANESHHTESSVGDPAWFCDVMESIVYNADVTQLRIAAIQFTNCCHSYADAAIRINNPLRALFPLKMAVDKLEPDCNTFTGIHADILRICLVSRQLKEALAFTKRRKVLALSGGPSPSERGVQPRDLPLFLYYYGCVLSAEGKYTNALHILHEAVVSPAQTPNAICLAAFKKYTLLCLIVHGVFKPPAYIPQVLTHYITKNLHAYSDITKAYSTKHSASLVSAAERYRATLLADGNWALIEAVMESCTRRNIQRLTKTYMTLSLSALAAEVDLPSIDAAERLLISMVREGQVHATIEHFINSTESLDGMVQFQDDPYCFSSYKSAKDIENQMNSLILASCHLQTLSVSLAVDAKHQGKLGGRSYGVNNDWDDTMDK